MKKYRVFLFTTNGPIMVEYCDSQSIAEFETEILAIYGQFTTLHTEEIINP